MTNVTIAPNPGAHAGAAAAAAIASAVESRGRARVVFASAPSQEEMLATLTADPRVDWSRVDSFHLDEYLGLPASHPRAFGQWLADRLPAEARPGLQRIDAGADPEAEIQRYTTLLGAAPLDVTCLGVGMNGHVAFNEPGDVEFDDPTAMRLVQLELASRLQQVEEGLFATVDEVPTQALSLTFSALTRAKHLVCTVVGDHKAEAVAAALEGPVTTTCPASGLQQLGNVHWFLDDVAASRLTRVAQAKAG
ncbi:glucosamine-6-phosphate deaminase [Tessaracoccus terricola]